MACRFKTSLTDVIVSYSGNLVRVLDLIILTRNENETYSAYLTLKRKFLSTVLQIPFAFNDTVHRISKFFKKRGVLSFNVTKDHKIEIGANFQDNIIKRFLLKASKSVDIITWAISNFSVKMDNGRFMKIAEILRFLASEKNVKIRIIFGNRKDIPLVKNVFSFPGCETRLLEPNHSKIMLIDDVIGYVGSGNFTGAGLGSNWNKKHFNLEVSVLFWEEEDLSQLRRFFEIAWKYSVPV